MVTGIYLFEAILLIFAFYRFAEIMFKIEPDLKPRYTPKISLITREITRFNTQRYVINPDILTYG